MAIDVYLIIKLGFVYEVVCVFMSVCVFVSLCVCCVCVAELEITVGHRPFSNHFQGFGQANPFC